MVLVCFVQIAATRQSRLDHIEGLCDLVVLDLDLSGLLSPLDLVEGSPGLRSAVEGDGAWEIQEALSDWTGQEGAELCVAGVDLLDRFLTSARRLSRGSYWRQEGTICSAGSAC